MMRYLPAMFTALVVSVAPAAADSIDPGTFKGVWDVYRADGIPNQCVLTFSGKDAVKPSDACATEVPAVAKVTTWNVKGNTLHLSGAGGNPDLKVVLAESDASSQGSLEKIFTLSSDQGDFSLAVRPETPEINERQAEADALAGVYLLKSLKDTGEGCRIDLRNNGVNNYFNYALTEGCVEDYVSFMSGVIAWEPESLKVINFSGAEGRPELVLTLVSPGVFETDRSVEDVQYTLTKVK
jgi:hypothetical protein